MAVSPFPILLISRSVPPQQSGSAVIVGNLAAQFTPEEMIIAGEWPIGRPPVPWQPHWARLCYVGCVPPAHWRGERWWRYLQLPLTLARLARLALRYRCRAILGVFPNEEYLAMAYAVARWRRVPFYAYFHNTYLENRQGWRLRFAQTLQQRIFAEARHVFVMSAGMQNLYQERYPGLSCSPLVHSFNGVLPKFEPVPSPGSPLRLVMAGSIGEACRDAAVRLSEAVAGIPNTHLTILSGTAEGLLRRLGVLRPGMTYGSVAPQDVVRNLRAADIVLLPHGLTGGLSPEEYATIFPTRTLECLLSGRPILAHTPETAFLTAFLRQHDCALVVTHPDVARLRQAIVLLCQDAALRNRLVQNAVLTVEQFHAPQVAGKLRAQIAREFADPDAPAKNPLHPRQLKAE